MSELALKLIAKEKEEKTGSLDLGNCGLTELPEELFELTHLESLVVSNQYYDWREDKWIKTSNDGLENYLMRIPDQITLLTGLKKLIVGVGGKRRRLGNIEILESMLELKVLHLGFNEIADINFLEKLTNLEILDLSANQISDYSILKKLIRLKTLDLSNNQVKDYSFLDNLVRLKILDIRNNQISDIRFLKKMASVQVLFLQDNQISDIRFLERLTNLQSLNLSYNKVSDIRFLEKLTNLQSLDLSSNQISDYSFLEKLTNLQSLDLRFNMINNIQFLEKLTNLQSLNLRFNQISDIRFLGKLTNLKSLNLRSNKISDYSFLEKLINLQSLDLRFNLINDIRFLEKLTNLQSLDLRHNQVSDIRYLEKLIKLRSLHLRSNQIGDIRFLGKLINLQSLDLSSNQISDYSFLEKLTNLQSLDLSSNQISDYSFLEKLTNLQSLGLRFNQISDIRFLEKLTNLQSLDLSYNQISDIGFLEKLTNLQSLDLRHNQVSDIRFLEKLTNLQSLDLRHNQISDIRFLEKLTNILSLNLSSNQISDYSYLGKLANLQSLDLSSNRISDYSFVERLTNLQSLDLSSNQISDYSFLEKLTNLQSLDLSSNLINDYSFLEKLTNLQSLDLSSNQISDYSFLEKLTNLQSLSLHSNLISDIHFLEKLTNLQSLSLHSNLISDIHFLENLTNLQSLDLRSNLISDIRFLERLTNLQFLDLRSNKIRNIGSLKELAKKSLSKTLNISENKIEDLTPVLPLIKRGNKISWEEYGIGILVQDNPLKTPPPEIVKEGNAAVLQYFQDLEEQGIDHLYEAKLLIVGEGESGKTTLARKLKNMDAPMPRKGDDRTKGIDIQSLEIINQADTDRPFRMNIWDFGGQEIYHATHQFFLTKRSLYLIVNNTRSNLTDFNHWVQTINLFSDNSPILIVQNEVAGSITDFDLRGLQQYFANVLGLKDSDLSNTEDGRLQKLIREIHHQIQQLDHVGMELPKQWVAVRKDLEVQAREKPFISHRDFFHICEQNKITDKEAMLRIGDIFHDLGVLLYFHEDPILRKLVILQNSWATKGVYAILDNERIQKQKGRFSFTDADQIWGGTEFEGKEMEILQLMTKFELCYKVPFQEPAMYVSPQLLPKEKPIYSWDDQHNLILYYRYEFMPKGLLGRLIVRLHRYIKDIDQFAWRTGCIFTHEDTDAQVIETYGTSRIEIRIDGKHQSRIATIITKEIDELNDSFERIEVNKWIPCNCSKCSTIPTPYFFEYESLMTRKAKGKITVECDKSYEDVRVQDLLDGVFVSIEEPTVNIRALLKKNKIEEALNVLEGTHPDDAIVLMRQFNAGQKDLANGVILAEEWSVRCQRIVDGILKACELDG